MTEDDAVTAIGHLVGAINGFTDGAITEYTEQFEKLDDAAVLNEVCQALAATWQERWRPTVADVLARYHDHPTIRGERENRVAAALASGNSAPPTTWSEGQAIANDEYRNLFGRNPGEDPLANPVYAAQVIEREGRRDLEGNWLARYVDVLRAFRGDHPRTQRSLHALGSRLQWDNRGRLTLRPERATEPPAASYDPPAAPEPTEPADSLRGATELMRQALGETTTALTDD
jgi:hypothetical protein